MALCMYANSAARDRRDEPRGHVLELADEDVAERYFLDDGYANADEEGERGRVPFQGVHDLLLVFGDRLDLCP